MIPYANESDSDLSADLTVGRSESVFHTIGGGGAQRRLATNRSCCVSCQDSRKRHVYLHKSDCNAAEVLCAHQHIMSQQQVRSCMSPCMHELLNKP